MNEKFKKIKGRFFDAFDQEEISCVMRSEMIEQSERFSE